MAIIGVTDVGTSRADIVSAVVQETLKQRSILLPTVSQFMAPAGAKSVLIPRRAQFAAEAKTEDTDWTGQAMVFTQDTLALDLHKAIYAELEMIASIQATPNVEAEIIKEAAAELALQIDKDLITQLKLVSTSAPDHLLDYSNTPTDTVQLVDIANARMLLNKQNVPMEDRFMVISPDQEYAMLQIANFIQAERYGSSEALLNGEIGKVFGFKVLVHNSLSAVDALFYHKMHVGFAMQQNPEFKTDENLKGVKKEFLLHGLYGAKVLQAGKCGVYFNGAGS